MATNLDVITSSLRLLNVINSIQVPTAEQDAQGLTILNDMMADWEQDGIELGYYPQTASSDTIPVLDQYLRGIKYNLAFEMAPFFGTSLTQEALAIAQETKDRLVKGTVEVVDSSFGHMPAGNTGYYDINNE